MLFYDFNLDAGADLFAELILLDLCLAPFGGICDGRGVLRVQLAIGFGCDFV